MTTQFPTDIRRNWGYWDGIAARERGRQPPWCAGHIYKGRHPTDRAYGEGFWAGFYGEAHPNQKTRKVA